MDDRHARARRTLRDGRTRPPDGFRTRSLRRFEALVADAVSGLPPTVRAHLTEQTIRIAEVPPAAADAEVILCRSEPAGAGSPVATLTLYRRPLEARASGPADLLVLLQEVLTTELTGGPDDDPTDRRP